MARLRLLGPGLLACLWLAPALALEIPPVPRNAIFDGANVLDAAAESRLARRLAEFEEATSNEIAVAIFPSLEDEALEDFTIRLVEAWRPGQADRDNGVLLAVFMKERRVRIEVGYGLEGALTDALARRIIRDELAPPFREGRYADGVQSAVVAIMAATRGEYQGRGRAREGPGDGQVLLVLLVLLVLFLILGRAFGDGGPRSYSGQGMFGGFGRGIFLGGGGGFGRGGFGRGGFGGGGGGFGGFGGGGFGGGGSSGGW